MKLGFESLNVVVVFFLRSFNNLLYYLHPFLIHQLCGTFLYMIHLILKL